MKRTVAYASSNVSYLGRPACRLRLQLLHYYLLLLVVFDCCLHRGSTVVVSVRASALFPVTLSMSSIDSIFFGILIVYVFPTPESHTLTVGDGVGLGVGEV